MNIVKPTLLLDQERAIRNIERMAQKAKNSGVRFRPHFKTHQSATIGAWFKKFDVNAITVSSVDMAEYFARHGWQDITIAFPVNPREIEKINRGAMLEDSYIMKLSQEHGIASTTKDIFEHIRIGDLVFVLPIHSCLTANLLRKYYTLDGTMIELANLV